MSQWNLSVRLTGQGTGLTRTLRDASREARSLSRDINTARRDLNQLQRAASRPLRIGVPLDANRLRADVRRAVRQAGTGSGITIPLRVNASQLRREVRTALGAASGQGLGVSLRLTDARQLRRDVSDAVRWASWGHRIEIPLVLGNRMGLRRDVSDAVRWASMNQTVTVRVRADTSDLGDLTRILNRPGGGGGGGMGGALQGLLMLAPAAIPLLAGLSANLAPVAGQFAAGGAAAGAFGIALAGQVGPLTDSSEALQKYTEAVTLHGEHSKEAMEAAQEYRLQVAAMPLATQRAATAVSILKDDFQEWSDGLADFTMDPVTRGIAVLDELIPHLTPEVKSASTQLDRLVTVAGGAISTPGFDSMSE